MRVPFHQVDAFTSRPFGGNPAAVVILERMPSDGVMQAVAVENNLSETAFVVPAGETAALRWFTPTMEIDLCGHATLATAHVLFETGRVPGATIGFDTRSGRLTVHREGTSLAMDFPSRPPERGGPVPGLAAALGAEPAETWTSTRDLVAVYPTESDVARLAPDFGALAAIDAIGFAATAPGDAVDFVSRFFAPRAGVPEDPVTGSAHCVLAPYWADRLGKPKLRARQISRRVGEVDCEMRGDRVVMRGQAVQVIEGTMEIPDVSPD